MINFLFVFFFSLFWVIILSSDWFIINVEARYLDVNRLSISVSIRNKSQNAVQILGYTLELWDLGGSKSLGDSLSVHLPAGEEISFSIPTSNIRASGTFFRKGRVTFNTDYGSFSSEFDIVLPNFIEMLEIRIDEPVKGEEVSFNRVYVVLHPRRPLITEDILLRINYDNILKLVREVRNALSSPICCRIGVEQLKGIGREIFNFFDTHIKLGSLINELKPVYLLFETSSSSWDLPLELMFDGQEFIAVKHGIGRILRSSSVSRVISPIDFIKRERGIRKILAIFSFIGFDDMRDVSKIIDKMIGFFNGLRDKGLDMKLMSIKNPIGGNYIVEIVNEGKYIYKSEEVVNAVINFLQSGDVDLIYISAHGLVVNNRAFLKITNDNNHQLFSEDIRERLNFGGKPIIILNSCLAGTVLAPSFLEAGARALIAPVYEVDMKLAYEFVRELLNDDFLKGKKPIGKILQEVKRKMKNESRGGIDWISFILYGDPRLYP